MRITSAVRLSLFRRPTATAVLPLTVVPRGFDAGRRFGDCVLCGLRIAGLRTAGFVMSAPGSSGLIFILVNGFISSGRSLVL